MFLVKYGMLEHEFGFQTPEGRSITSVLNKLQTYSNEGEPLVAAPSTDSIEQKLESSEYSADLVRLVADWEHNLQQEPNEVLGRLKVYSDIEKKLTDLFQSKEKSDLEKGVALAKLLCEPGINGESRRLEIGAMWSVAGMLNPLKLAPMGPINREVRVELLKSIGDAESPLHPATLRTFTESNRYRILVELATPFVAIARRSKSEGTYDESLAEPMKQFILSPHTMPTFLKALESSNPRDFINKSKIMYLLNTYLQNEDLRPSAIEAIKRDLPRTVTASQQAQLALFGNTPGSEAYSAYVHSYHHKIQDAIDQVEYFADTVARL